LHRDENHHNIPEREYFLLTTHAVPFMEKVLTVTDIGRLARARRRQQQLTQNTAAGVCGVGVRFISDLENGKATIEMGKALEYLQCLGLEIYVQPKGRG
jgi:y4mF family transcriptional regulator